MIVAGLPVDRVVAGPAREVIVVLAAVDDVVARAAVDHDADEAVGLIAGIADALIVSLPGLLNFVPWIDAAG